MLKYALTKELFSCVEDFEKAKQAVKNKVISLDDLKIIIDINIINLYNSLLSHFFGSGRVRPENIYKREVVHAYIYEFEPNLARFFPILTQNGLINVCGRGYMFEVERLKQTESEYHRMIYIYFNLGIVV